MDIKGKVVLITGASSGIGRATAELLAKKGAQLLLVARRQKLLEDLAEGLRTDHKAEVLPVAADITKTEDREHILGECRKHFGELHLLINNAGITAHGRFDKTDLQVLRKTMELNFFSAVELTSLLLPLMKSSAGRKGLVLVSTPSGLYGIPGRFAYSASKAAGHAWMESLRVELKQEGFFASIVCPGYTRTALRSSGLQADGSILQEEQASSAKSPDYMAQKIFLAIQRERRLVLTDTNGRFVYFLRCLAPGFLESIMAKKLASDFQK